MRREEHGVTLIEVAVVLLVVGDLMGAAVPTVGAALEGYRASGATADLYAPVHLTKAGRGFRIIADPGGAARTVEGPHPLVDEAVATCKVTIQFSTEGLRGARRDDHDPERRRDPAHRGEPFGARAHRRRRGPRLRRAIMATADIRRGRNGRQDVGAAWQKTGSSGPFLAIEIDAGAVIADAIAALLRGDERLSYLAFTNEKKPDGRDGQPDLRLVRPLRRGGDDAA